MQWSQVYDPLGNPVLSPLVASVPVVVLLGSLAFLRVKAHLAAAMGLASALLVATIAFGMPAGLAARSAALGAAFGLLPIGWIILNVIFLYTLAGGKGLLEVVQSGLMSVTRDRRLQLLLVAFCFGAFFEGAAGFGTPVAVTAAILIGLGFDPLPASGLSLIANTAPVAFGAMGTPLVALQGVTGLDLSDLSATVGRQLCVFAVIVPFWLIWAFAGFRRMLEVWPALLVAGVSFAVPELLMSNLHGPWLVGIVSALCSMAALVAFLLRWRPRIEWRDGEPEGEALAPTASRSDQVRAWAPWLILSVVVFAWSLPATKRLLDGLFAVKLPVHGLDQVVLRIPPVVAAPAAEPAVYSLNLLSATGTSILVAAAVSGLLMGYGIREMVRAYIETLHRVRFSLLTIACMLALGYVTRYGGLDATLGLACAHAGVLYPFFGTLLGWLGVALTGSDTSSNVLFGSLQTISAHQVGVSPTLMASANSAGGVMGKMIDAQSIVVASTATRWYGHEGSILRYVFLHSLALACLVGLLVLLQAYVPPFTLMVR